MKKVYNPGCYVALYKPQLVDKMLKALNRNDKVELHSICCHHNPEVEIGTTILHSCPSCDKRFKELYKDIKVVSVWEELAESNDFDFPDYKGKKMSIHDACTARNNPNIHQAIRKLLIKMNIEIVEAEKTCEKSSCCGDSMYSKLPIEKINEISKKRAESMPCEDVVVYCVTCIKTIKNGGKTPHFIDDLLFNESTDPQEIDLDEWHKKTNEFRNKYSYGYNLDK